MTDTIEITMRAEVDLSSEEAQQIYAAVLSALCNGSFIGETNPLRICERDGKAYLNFYDASVEGAEGFREFSDAVGYLMIFDDEGPYPISPKWHTDDINLAMREAEVVADALEAGAKRIRDKIAVLKQP